MSASTRFYLDGIEGLERDFRRIEVELSDAARRGALAGAQAGIAQAKASHPYTDRTGKLTSTSYARLDISTPGGAMARMVWPVKYASFVENGTSPHAIFGNPLLHFIWKGVTVTFRAVHHPGTKPYPFAGPALQKAERVMYRELEVASFRSQAILDAA